MRSTPMNFSSMYPEFIIPADQLETFKKERNACIVGKKIMDKYGWKIGDIIPIEGDIYPGHWQFVIRGVYTGKDRTVDETQMFLQWSYLNEVIETNCAIPCGSGRMVCDSDRECKRCGIHFGKCGRPVCQFTRKDKNGNRESISTKLRVIIERNLNFA